MTTQMPKPRRVVAASNLPVVCNTTPLINLVGIGHLDLLPGLYGGITIAAAVRDEFVAGKTATDPDLDLLSWLQIVPAAPFNFSFPPHARPGEATTLSLPSSLNE